MFASHTLSRYPFDLTTASVNENCFGNQHEPLDRMHNYKQNLLSVQLSFLEFTTVALMTTSLGGSNSASPSGSLLRANSGLTVEDEF